MFAEADLARLLEDGLATLRIPFYHTHDSRRSAKGFPDYILGTVPIIAAELKAEGGTLTPDQADWLADLGAGGADVFVVVGVEGVELLLREAQRTARHPRRAVARVLGSGRVRLPWAFSASASGAVDQ